MSATRMTKIPKPMRSEAPGSLSGVEILHELGRRRAPEGGLAGRAMLVWIGAGLTGALACWWIVADHFALPRPMDLHVSLTINHLASHNAVVNHAIYIASQAYVVTGALLVALVWYCWFNDDAEAARERLLLGFCAALIAGVLSRLLQVSLPMRLRPMHALDSGFQPLAGIDPALANHWGSFPSDHAVLLFALVIVVGQRSGWLGLLALLGALFGTLPRIYLGLHYLSDVAAGAVFGVAFVLLFERFGPRLLARRGMDWEQRLPGVFYGVGFLASFEVATLFNDIRQAGRGIPAVLKQLGL